MIRRRLAETLAFLLVFLLPFGTRQIWQYGNIGGVAVEWGTVSLFGTQILVIVLFLASVLAAGGSVAWKTARHPISVVALLLAVISSVSAVITPFGEIGSAVTVAAWSVMGWLVIMSMLNVRIPPRTIHWGFLLSAGIQSALAIFQFLTQSTFASKWLGMAFHEAASLGTFVVETGAGRWIRAYGSFGHPNMLGFFLVLGVISGAALLASGLDFRRRTVVWVSLEVTGAALLFSLSRSAFLAGAVALTVGIVVSLLNRNRHLFRSIVFTSLVVLWGALAVSFAVRDLALSRLDLTSRLETQSVSERISLMGDATSLYRSHSWLGVGPGQMPQSAYLTSPIVRSPWSFQPVHNVPMLVATETGLFGLAAWVILIGLVLNTAIRQRRTTDGPLVLAMLAAILTVSLFDHFLWSLWPGQLVFWVVVALAFRRS